MNASLTLNGSLASFLLAVLVYFLFGAAIDAFVTRPESQKIFHFVLLIICLVIALGGGFFIKL